MLQRNRAVEGRASEPKAAGLVRLSAPPARHHRRESDRDTGAKHGDDSKTRQQVRWSAADSAARAA
jgi:hypothetical protein